MKERFIHPFIAILLLAGSVGQTDAQLLFRQGEPYTNYAFEGYRAYESLIFGRTRSPQFDNLGQFVMNGVSVYELNEQNNQSRFRQCHNETQPVRKLLKPARNFRR